MSSMDVVILSKIRQLENDIDKMSIVKLARMFDERSLSKLYYAYIAKCYMYDDKFDDNTIERMIDLADYAFLKSESVNSIFSYIDAIITLIESGKSLDELENLSKWDLLSTLDSAMPY